MEMKQLFDYLPVIVFFSLYFAGGRDIMLATWGIIAACTLQVTVGWLLWRRVERMHLIVFVVTLIFGGMTLAFQNEIFIKWRPSIISFVLAAVLLLGHFLRDRNLLQRLCESLMQSGLGFVIGLTRRDWAWLNLAFVLYFAFIGGINIWVAYTFSTDFWVNFKLFGLTAIQFLFYIAVFVWVYRRMSPEDRARITGKDDKTDHDDHKDQEKDDAVRDHQ
jgi:intracellular septation protein